MIEIKRCPCCHKKRDCFNRGKEEEIITDALDRKLAIFTSYYTCLYCRKDFKIYETYSLHYEFTKTSFET